MRISVRRARSADAGVVARLYLDFWREHRNFDPLIGLKSVGFSRHVAWARKDIQNRKLSVLLAEVDGSIAGFLLLYIERNQPWYRVERFGHIDAALVLKKFRGKGVLRALCREAERILRSKRIKHLRLGVYARNEVAVSAWKKIGSEILSFKMGKKV